MSLPIKNPLQESEELDQQIKNSTDPYSPDHVPPQGKNKISSRDIFDDPIKIIELKKELEKSFNEGKLERVNQYLLNDRYIKGKQWGAIGSGLAGEAKIVDDVWSKRLAAFRISVNLLGPACATFRTLITKERPSAEGVAKRVSKPEAQIAADMVTKLIEHYESELSIQNKLDKAVDFGIAGGTGAMKVIYHTENNIPQVVPLSIMDFAVEACKPDYLDSDYVVFKDKISRWKAKELLESAGHRRY